MQVGFVLPNHFRDSAMPRELLPALKHWQSLHSKSWASPPHQSCSVFQQLDPPNLASSSSPHHVRICSPKTILQCFCQNPRAKQRRLASAAKLPPALSGGGEQRNTRTKQAALKEMATCLPARFSAEKKQPNAEVSFLPHSLTQKKASQLSAVTCQGD